MFGLGVPEVIFILVIALLLFGPKKLPEVGRVIGRGLGEFRKASTELQRAINTEIAVDEPAPPRPRLRSAEPEPEPEGPVIRPRPASENQPRADSSNE